MKTPTNFTSFTSVKPTEEETASEKNNASETISSAGGDLRKRKAEKILEKIEPGQKATEKQQKELLKLKKGSMRYEDRNEKRKERYAAHKERVDAKRERYAEKMFDKGIVANKNEARDRFDNLRGITVRSRKELQNVMEGIGESQGQQKEPEVKDPETEQLPKFTMYGRAFG